MSSSRLLYNSSAFPLDAALIAFLRNCENVQPQQSDFQIRCPIDSDTVPLLLDYARNPSSEKRGTNLRKLLALSHALGHRDAILHYSRLLEIPLNPILTPDTHYATAMAAIASRVMALPSPIPFDFESEPNCLIFHHKSGMTYRYSSCEEPEYEVPVVDNETPMFFKSKSCDKQGVLFEFCENVIVGGYALKSYDFERGAAHLKSWRLTAVMGNGTVSSVDEVGEKESVPLNDRNGQIERRLGRTYVVRRLMFQMTGTNWAGTMSLVIGSISFNLRPYEESPSS
jgi:hypothetical protein